MALTRALFLVRCACLLLPMAAIREARAFSDQRKFQSLLCVEPLDVTFVSADDLTSNACLSARGPAGRRGFA